MSTLNEVKGRMASVKSTLKITSAMKLVASAKYRKAQAAAERLAIYQDELSRLLSMVSLPGGQIAAPVQEEDSTAEGKVAVVALSSNSSLCGGFNTNVIAKAKAEIAAAGGAEKVELFAIGRKMSEALAKAGIVSQKDYTELSAHPSYAEAALLADSLAEGFRSGRLIKVILVWSHYVSASCQRPVVETLLPFKNENGQGGKFSSEEELLSEYIVEPDIKGLYDELLPKTLRLKLYSVLLDSAAAEHAARMIAMQTATDNGQELLADLTLEYNKGRQAKITSEILDLAAGAQEQE